MNKLVLIALSFVASSAFADIGQYNDSKSCIITYVKAPTTSENLVMACDGNLILNVKVAPFTAQYGKDLETSFKLMVNSDAQKLCVTADTQNSWYVLCYK